MDSRSFNDTVAIERMETSVYRFPTDAPESDGTLAWSSTTMVLVEVEAGGRRGLGFSYTAAAAAAVIRDMLEPLVVGGDAMEIPRIVASLFRAVRNVGQVGMAAHAISAVDVALWDLKARLLGLPLITLLGRARASVPIYGSGGFTSYSIERLQAQLGGWAEEGMPAVKMKIGRDPAEDPRRIRAAREAIGPDTQLFVDANGAFHPRQALDLAALLSAEGVTWFEEPVPSWDPEGLRFVRESAPAGVQIVAGEYSNTPQDHLRLLEAGAVDVLQADATRCGGLSGFLRAAALSEAWQLPISAHTAPSIHVHACCAAPGVVAPLEYFHDHVRIESRFFEGAPIPRRGRLEPDERAPGLGLRPRYRELEEFRIA